MGTFYRHIITILLAGFFLLSAGMIRTAEGQRVSFGTHVQDLNGYELTLTKGMPEELDFGTWPREEGTVRVLLSDNEAVPIAIEGVAYLDVTVTLTAPTTLNLVPHGENDITYDATNTMPVSIEMAYYNRGEEGVAEDKAKSEAITVIGNTITFQIARRPGGPPGPPPTPPHSGYTPPKAIAYLFIYGNLEIGNVVAGDYAGEIDVHVEYTTHPE